MKHHAIAMLPLLALISACGSKLDKANENAQPATGQVLGGTISDAMLPLDSATSTSPLERRSPSPSVNTPPAAQADDAAAADTQATAAPEAGEQTQD